MPRQSGISNDDFRGMGIVLSLKRVRNSFNASNPGLLE
jgi:hypothetical protein